jgi:hypothetical protein
MKPLQAKKEGHRMPSSIDYGFIDKHESDSIIPFLNLLDDTIADEVLRQRPEGRGALAPAGQDMLISLIRYAILRFGSTGCGRLSA